MDLKQAKTEFYKRLNAGEIAQCPCCGRTAKIYKRSITNWMAYGLIRLYWESKRINPGMYQDLLNSKGWIHLGKFFQEELKSRLIINDLPKLRHWGLIATAKEPVQGIKRSGFYYVTEKGALFVEGRTTVPKFLHIYNDEVLGATPEGKNDLGIPIKECLGNRFKYDELMEPSPVQREFNFTKYK